MQERDGTQREDEEQQTGAAALRADCGDGLGDAQRLDGDQDWLNEQMPGIATFPSKWCLSYKHQVRLRGPVPETVRVIVYHGRPKPWDIGLP